MAINKEIKDYVKVGENEWIEDFFLTAEKNQELKDLRADLTTETQRATDRETELDTKIDNTYDKITEESDDKLYTKIKNGKFLDLSEMNINNHSAAINENTNLFDQKIFTFISTITFNVFVFIRKFIYYF